VDPEPIMANLELREAYLLPMLDVLDDELGGVELYLSSIGITEHELALFREQFVDEA